MQQSDSVTKLNSADITSDWGDIILRPSALIQEIKPTKEVFIQQYLTLSCTHSALYQMSCEGACEMASKTCVRSACVRSFFPLVTPTHVGPHILPTFQVILSLNSHI